MFDEMAEKLETKLLSISERQYQTKKWNNAVKRMLILEMPQSLLHDHDCGLHFITGAICLHDASLEAR